jgi:hypothetical protein
VPGSQVVLFTGAIKTDFPGIFTIGVGVGAEESLPPHEVSSTKQNKLIKVIALFITYYCFITLIVSSIVFPFK